MAAHLDVWDGRARRVVELAGPKVMIGRSKGCDVAFEHDDTISRQHAILHEYESGWSITDLASANGTFVNGERIRSEFALRPDADIRIGAAQLVFRCTDDRSGRTVTWDPAPARTKAEQRVLDALCRPMTGDGVFRQPASVKEIAAELYVGEAAVKANLLNLYRKFGLDEEAGPPRRVRLANEAVRRGAVSPGELDQPTRPGR